MAGNRTIDVDIDRPTQVITSTKGAPIRRVPMALARRFLQICTAVAAETLDADDLTPQQYAVIVHVGEEPGIDQAGIAARIGIDRNTTGLLVEQLERRGLLKRAINGADRRARLARLTKQGTDLHERLRPVMRANQRAVLSALPPREREKFLDQLVAIIRANEIYARPGAGRRKRGSKPRNK
jgi:DNA-binding MarR family transcriptional regulator